MKNMTVPPINSATTDPPSNIRNQRLPKQSLLFTANYKHEILSLLESDEPCNNVDVFSTTSEWLALLLPGGETSLVVLSPTPLPFQTFSNDHYLFHRPLFRY